ncbi:MAG TPA: AmmeMemoRadiSam system protein A [Gammaproteobacteria bacterium]|nr:AmmeMemoRadiSam system protein A [Gammaproteobacteria bacterium]
MNIESADKTTLLELARAAIRKGLATPIPPTLPDVPVKGPLAEPGATFVTLTRTGNLRGCRGTLVPIQPLAADVAANAFFSAFEDPRFRPLTAEELDDLALEIAVLSPLEPLPPLTEAELLDRLRPGVDGLLIEDAGRRATFLPKVWNTLPEPADFVRELKRKAGLPAAYWTRAMRCQRYTTENFGAAFASSESESTYPR